MHTKSDVLSNTSQIHARSCDHHSWALTATPMWVSALLQSQLDHPMAPHTWDNVYAKIQRTYINQLSHIHIHASSPSFGGRTAMIISLHRCGLSTTDGSRVMEEPSWTVQSPVLWDWSALKSRRVHLWSAPSSHREWTMVWLHGSNLAIH